MTIARLEHRLRELRAEGCPALVIYLTIGDPSVEDSLACARAALDAGADILELGVPFSDPTADGPVIAAASHRAIAAGGSLRATLEVARRLRETSEAPLVSFSYLNPILAFGETSFPGAAAEAGIDAILVVDLPPEEGRALRASAAAAQLGLIPLVAPTTSVEREASIVAGARGFAYYVSLTGVTGADEAPLAEAGQRAVELRARSGLPVVVGFGIDTPDKARLVARTGVDGVVVGSAVVKTIAAQRTQAGRMAAVRELVRALRSATRRVSP
jgi:tryptophan synthase alpha chain